MVRMEKRSLSLPILLMVTVAVGYFLFSNRPRLPLFSPTISYGLMFDAGSTGSRVHVFSFDASGKLVDEIFKEVKPGLSAYKDPKEAAQSLVPLLEISMRAVPKDQRTCTPLALKATAGLRRLGRNKAEEHLQAVRDLLATYPFHTEKDAVEIMSGTDEAAFAWITINHLLGRLDGGSKSTVSVMDLGGGSTQIVLEPSKASLKLAPASVKYNVHMGSAQHQLYQHSYDGWGLHAAREKLFAYKVPDSTAADSKVPHPCIPAGHEEKVKLKGKDFLLTPSDDTSFLQCLALAKKIFDKEAPCEAAPCSFNGVHQPQLTDESVFKGEMYAISYFYDRTQLEAPKPELTVGEFKTRAEAACKSTVTGPTQGVLCADLTYMYALLTHGYDLKDDQKLQIAKKINGIETAWSLGAMVVLMKSTNLSCLH
eukprot:GGOE01053727.1.p1 GENE.GGOE01053727.1~~GGOE01053727.1.p1  ORF type:complete len:425 (-),score=131.18 GGOE01053727.1:407-1681(-)